MEKAKKASESLRNTNKLVSGSSDSSAWKKQVLSERLRTLMGEKNLTVMSTAKLMQERLHGQEFNPVNLSHYRAGRSLPRPLILKALSDVLGVRPEHLVPIPPGEVKVPSKLESQDYATTSNGVAHNFEESSPASSKKQSAALVPAFNIEDLAEGEAWLQINQRLSWPTVIKILEILKGDIKDKP